MTFASETAAQITEAVVLPSSVHEGKEQVHFYVEEGQDWPQAAKDRFAHCLGHLFGWSSSAIAENARE